MNAFRIPRYSRFASGARSGFTLIELMVVVVIVAILVSLLVPAVMSVSRRARDAQVIKDISDLEQGIAQFKLSYGIDPPSSITLYAKPPNATGGAPNWDNDPADQVGAKRSKGLIRQIWPKFDFANCGGISNGTTFNNHPGTPDKLTLNGAECLVFFLGGVIDSASGAFIGFSKSPTQPFVGAIGASGVTNREGPFFEFKGGLRTPLSSPPAMGGDSYWTGRLTDKDGDWLPEYRDPLPQQTNPYVYFNASNGNYRTVGTPWQNTDGAPFMNYAYYSKIDTSNFRASVPYKAKGLQIISPGADGFYGTGGLFTPGDSSCLSAPGRNVEIDNLTNFHTGRLGG